MAGGDVGESWARCDLNYQVRPSPRRLFGDSRRRPHLHAPKFIVSGYSCLALTSILVATLFEPSLLKCTVTCEPFMLARPATPSLAPVTSVRSLYVNCISCLSADRTVSVLAV